MAYQEDVNFGFVILHYLVDNATAECVESIHQHCKNENYHIVIVDNNSANGSFERLEKRFADDPRVTLIHNDRNEGFARGNAVGYRYCRTILHCNYIATINNDATLASDNFITESVADYELGGYGVIGPDIISGRTGEHQNPVNGVIDSLEKVHKRQFEVTRGYILQYLRLSPYLQPLKNFLKRGTNSLDSDNLEELHSRKSEIVGEQNLHGACLIFTPIFVEHFSEPFDTRTFMYVEEDILYVRCREAGIKMYYDPTIQVHHEEDISTESEVSSDLREKTLFLLSNSRDSLKILERYFV